MRNTLIAFVVACVLTPVSAWAQVTIPNTFVAGTVASADKVNANFTALGAAALNRTGGTLTGNLSASNGVTIDGVDVSTLATTAMPQFAGVQLGALVGTHGGLMQSGTSPERVILGIPGTTYSQYFAIMNATGTGLHYFYGNGAVMTTGVTYGVGGFSLPHDAKVCFDGLSIVSTNDTCLSETTVGAANVLEVKVDGTHAGSFAAGTFVLPPTVVWSGYGTGDVKAISAGANDSGGTGYRVLRVSNTGGGSPSPDDSSIVGVLARLATLESFVQSIGGVK